MLQALVNSFKIPDLRKKLFITLLLLAIYRIGAYIPTPGVNGAALLQFFNNVARSQGGGLFGIMDMFSGGALTRLTIFALGIMPYISASIILQLLVTVVPYLEKLSKEGEAGRRKMIQYTRYGTIVLSVVQAFFISMWLESPARFQGLQIVDNPGWSFRLITVLTLTTGTAFIMWIGEQIQEYGIGNGISLVITAGIISRLPTALEQVFTLIFAPQKSIIKYPFFTLAFMSVIGVAVVVAVILITQGQRKIPVQYAKRIVGRKVYGGQNTYIPLRVNQAGVIPIIFAQSIILFPATVAGFIPNAGLQRFAEALMRGHILYTVLYSVLIIFFAYFYTAITFNPADVADNMKKYGGFVPGVRPGRPTAEYFDFIMTRITLPGAIFLAFIAVFPDMLGAWLKIPYLIASFFGGTALLIVVGVMLDTMRAVESQLLMRHYEGFLKKGKIRGRR
ncbi:MAG: preprotein translocase subunit SecY [Candidatus Omnitrophica bacterium CG02_land_8_20_14_3_00__42_8]|nr:MAG: preprotein translocase subunit SecY [Candidatus Omnitrophica bacterium CG02_land_8_20_14_3_00__42_8]PIW67469.1 MAG: preprotein translocase subunit SecY [Candidatus Omnitrophica bacterium CG12_big_fil_rev_8_21_14_0_65_42_8]